MPQKNADLIKFTKSFDYLLYNLNIQLDQNSSSSSLLYKNIYDSILFSKQQQFIPKKCKTTTSDLIKYIDKSSNTLHHSSSSSSTGHQQQQLLIKLLNDSKILNLIDAYDEISKLHWNVKLPEIPTDFDHEIGCAVKIVQLVKGSEALGATIKYTPEGYVFVSRLIAGGAAEKSGAISVGDRIISINGVSVDHKDPNEIAYLLNSSENSTVTFKLAPTALRKCMTSEKLKATKFVKALIDYDAKTDPTHPCPDAALKFTRGSILEIVNVNDRFWMQAKFTETVPSNSSSSSSSIVGVIPTDEKLSLDDNNATVDVIKNNRQLNFIAYEPVCQLFPKSNIIRTLVFIGPPGVGRNELKRRLILQKHHKYASTVPHTSRPPRAHEKDGIDYNFVSLQQMTQWIHEDRFIESGEFNGNLYGTLDDAILTVISRKQVPIINAHPSALKSLRSSRFMPLTIFIAPPSDLTILKKTRSTITTISNNHKSGHKQQRKFNDYDLEQMIFHSKQLELNYGHLFDAKIINDNLDAAFGTLCAILHNFDTLLSWIPSDWMVIKHPQQHHDV